jgi:hypothetical protein
MLSYQQKKVAKIVLVILLAIGVLLAIFHPDVRAWLKEKYELCLSTIKGWFKKK